MKPEHEDTPPSRPGQPLPPIGRRPSAFQRRRMAVRSVHRWRWLVRIAAVALIVTVAVRHSRDHGGAPSVDAVCPFGAVESAWTWLTTGTALPKIQPSNVVVAIGLLISILLAGNVFCGWVCPFGTVQDVLTKVRTWLRLPTVRLSARVDRLARHLRFVVLALVLVQSAMTARLWFADFDPFVTMFGLHWIFEPEPTKMWLGWGLLAIVLITSVLIERAWCRYLCPLGGILSILGRASLFRIRRREDSCTGCNLCVTPCPMGIDVAKPVPAVSSDCIGCLECLAQCPTGGALEVSARLPFTRVNHASPSREVSR